MPKKSNKNLINAAAKSRQHQNSEKTKSGMEILYLESVKNILEKITD
jgi:hypothetical protein